MNGWGKWFLTIIGVMCLLVILLTGVVPMIMSSVGSAELIDAAMYWQQQGYVAYGDASGNLIPLSGDNLSDLGTEDSSWNDAYIDGSFISSSTIRIMPSDDVDDYLTFLTKTGIPSIKGVGSYIRFGDSGTPSEGLDSGNDVFFAGKTEFANPAHFENLVAFEGGNVIFSNNTGFYLGNSLSYKLYYDSSNSRMAIRTTDSDGLGTDADVIRIPIAGLATDFQGSLTTPSFMQFTEMSAPGAGAANTARVYALEGGGDNLTDLCAVFQDGTVDVFAQETTPLDAPIFTYPSQTYLEFKMIKPHPGKIQFVLVFPDGEEFVLRELEYHSIDKINANLGAEGELPIDWSIVED